LSLTLLFNSVSDMERGEVNQTMFLIFNHYHDSLLTLPFIRALKWIISYTLYKHVCKPSVIKGAHPQSSYRTNTLLITSGVEMLWKLSNARQRLAKVNFNSYWTYYTPSMYSICQVTRKVSENILGTIWAVLFTFIICAYLEVIDHKNEMVTWV
jgi:hypothetical protein